MNLPNGGQASYTYDAASQLTELLSTIGATTISRFAYTYDAVGNRITRTTTNGIANYDSDALNRLFNATQPDPVDPLQQLTESFAYDQVGNRTSSHLATGQVHDAANRLREDSNFTYTYDANGNLATKTSKATAEVTTYTYDSQNQLIEVTATGLVATYRYDALGRRIEKVVNGVASRYVYDNEDILLELDGSNQVAARYTHGAGIDEPLVMLRGGQSFFYHIDALGSVWDVTDSAGTGVRSYSYDSFGQLLTQTGTLSNPYTYTARELDPETGLYYYRARYYEPVVGRFLQEDPSGFFGGINFYTYAQNDPLNFFDPWGLAGEDEWVFHERHHGGPHLQRGQDRYRYNPETRQLEPIPHKGRTPPHLSKSQLRKLMKTPAFKRMLRRLGLVGAAIAAIEIFEAATADKSEAFENLLEIIGDFPEDKRQMILEEVCKKNPDVCSAHFDEPLEEPECR